MRDIGDRMKENYENRARIYLTRRTPVIIRVDGKAFHTFTKYMDKPFDDRFMKSMKEAAIDTSKEMQGFKLGYVQSDEASFLLTDYDKLNTDAWFNYNIQKMVSVTAATMSINFAEHYGDHTKAPVFDARAFNIPKAEVINYFLWRAKDWERNSVMMLGQAHFSHKELHKKSIPDVHEMLYKIGKNWADLPPQHKNGTFLAKNDLGIEIRHDVPPVYEEIAQLTMTSLLVETFPE